MKYDESHVMAALERVPVNPVKKIGAAKFKEQCLAILERLDPGGLVITKHGKPVAFR